MEIVAMANPTRSYKPTAKLLHWAMALLVLATIPVGVVMTQDGLARPLQNALFIFHKNVGVVLLLLIVIRVVYRLRTPPPPEPGHLAGWQVMAARVTHGALYVLLLVMPLSGYIRVRAGGFPIEALDAMGIGTLVPRSDALAETAKTIHYFGSWAIGLLVALHVAAALQHAIIQKDGVFQRMWPGRA
jgi:cytochrome b561